MSLRHTGSRNPISSRRSPATSRGRRTHRSRSPGQAIERACDAALASAGGFEQLETRVLMAASPVIVFNFDEGLTDPAATTVANTGTGGASRNGALAGDLVPTFGGTADDGTRSPAGGTYLSFEGDGVFQTGVGGRVEVGSDTDRTTWLHPILGNTMSIAFWVKTDQISPRGEIWASPGVSGVEHSGFADDVFVGSVTQARGDGMSRLRGAGGNGAAAETLTPNDGTWHHVVETRDPTSGVVRMYVDGVLQASANSETGVKGGHFRSIGAQSVTNNPDQTAIAGYTHFNGDLDQIEVYNVVLTPKEVGELYGPDAAAPPAAPVVAVTSPGPRSALLQWADVEGELGYTVLRSQSATGPFAEVITLAPGTTTFTDANVVTGQTYYYQVQAFNAAGISTSATAGPITISATGNGVTAHYFNTNFWGEVAGVASAENRPNHPYNSPGEFGTIRVTGAPTVTEGVPFINFNYGNGAPAPAPFPTDNFSTLFTGKIVAPETGTYTILGHGDDDTHVYVNGILVSSDPLGHGIPGNDAAGMALINYKYPIDLVEGEAYDLVVLQAEGGGGAGVILRWITPSDADPNTDEVVPQSALRTTTEAPQPVTDLVVDATGPDTVVTINFTDASTRELRFDLERSLDNGTTWTFVNDRGINQTQIADNNPAAVTALYRVVAVNMTGRTPSATISVEPRTPVAQGGASAYFYNDQWWNSRAPVGGTAGANDIVVGRNPDLYENVGDIDENWGTNADGLYSSDLTGPGSAGPNPLIRDSRFSSVFTGKIRTNEAGVYTILGFSDDDSFVWVDGRLASADPGGHGIPANDAGGIATIDIRNPLTLEADTEYNFVAVQSEGGGGAGMILRWITPDSGGVADVIPEANLSSLPDLPAAPTSLAAPFVQSRVVVLRWGDASKSEVRYSIARAAADEAGNPTGPFTELALLPINATQYNDTTAQPNQRYVYRLRAENFRGVGESTVAANTLADEPTPATPTNLAVWNLHDRNRITFTDNATNETNFVIERKLASDPDSAFFRIPNTPVAPNGPGNTGNIVFTDADPLLTPGATYVYRVATINVDGDMSPYVTLPSAVAGLEANIYDADGREGARGIVEGASPYDPVVRVDPFIDFDFGNGAPDSRVSIDHYAIVWEGTFTAPEDGDFTFFGESDDGMRVFLDGQIIVDAWVDRGTTETASTPVTLVAGQRYPIQVQYYENGGGAVARLRYQGPTTPKQIVPTTQLNRPDPTTPLVAPLSTLAENTLADCVRVSWVDANTNETGFLVQRNPDASNEAGWAAVATLPSNQQMYLDMVGPTDSFYYRIVPINGTTSGPASEASAAVGGSGEAGGAFNFADFTAPETRDQWQLNAVGTNANPSFFDASGDGTEDTLRLMGGATGDAFDGQTGSAFLTTPRHIRGFTASFDFIMGGAGNESANPADGFMFVIQNDARGPGAVGGGGGALGWQGITNSVGVKFDVFNNIDETGLYVDGQAIADGTGDVRNRNLRTVNGSQPAIDLDSGNPWRVTLSYDPVARVLSMSLDDVGNAATAPFFASWQVDIPHVIGGDCAYVGFTGATGGESVRADIKSFQFTPGAPAVALPSLSVANVTVNEGNSGTSNAVFRVTLSGASTQVVRVNYATSNAGATAGASPNDYTSTSGTLTFNPGETFKDVNVPVLGDATAEPNEAFFFTLSNAVNAALANARAVGAINDDDRVTTPAPVHVTQVFVNGAGLTGQTSANGVAFRNLAGIDNTYGYSVPAGTNQLKSIPWNGGVNQIALRFDQDVTGTLEMGDLVVRGSNTPVYAVTAFTYDAATRTGVWTLATPITNDKVRLFLDDAMVNNLDGEWQDANAAEAFPSGDGTAGGDFSFRLNVLRGDATQDGVVNALDLSFIKQRLNRTATNPGSGGAVYSVFADLTADGSINALDLSAAKQRLNNRLPTTDPASALLFSTRPISR